MRFTDPSHHRQAYRVSSAVQTALVRVSFCLVGSLLSIACTQQATEANNALITPKPGASAPAVTVATPTSGPKWQDLTGSQQVILKPLTSIWNSLEGTSKSKWIAITLNYATRSPAEQQRMQERMGEWAALKPAERERARLNFAETKKLSPNERAAEWEAYQGLSAHEKNTFAKAGNGKPVGAAVAIVPVSTDKLTPVPLTRRTPANDEAVPAVVRPSLNPKTLLPTPAMPQETSVAPVADAATSPESAPDTVPPDKRLTIN